MITIILAHGALGAWDEIIFLGIALIFIGLMGLTWIRSQTIKIEDEEEEPQTPAHRLKKDKKAPRTPDHFKLD